MRHRLLVLAGLTISLVVSRSSTCALAAPVDVLGGDTRLLKLVQFEARHAPTDEFLARVTQETGVLVKADDHAADLRLTLFVSNVRLRDVLEGLSTVLHLTWRRANEGEKSEYTLCMSENDWHAAEEAKAAVWEEFRSDIWRIIRAATDPRAPTSAPSDRAARVIATTAGGGSAARFLSVLPSAVVDSALRGRSTRISFSSLSPIQQEALRDFGRSLRGELIGFRGQTGAKVTERHGNPSVISPSREPDPVEMGGVELSLRMAPGMPVDTRILISLWDSHGVDAGLALVPPTLSWRDELTIPRHFGSRRPAPALLDCFKLPEVGLPWDDALWRCAQGNGVNVLSDAFEETAQKLRFAHPWPSGAGSPPEQLLDWLCAGYNYTWSAESSVLLFRHRQWATLRDREIPERLARRWRQIASDRGGYPLDELARMASLNDGQVTTLRRLVGPLVYQTVYLQRDILRVYDALRPAQRSLARQEGLAVDHLDVSQQQLLTLPLARIRPGPLTLGQSFVRLKAWDVSGEPVTTITVIFRDAKRETITLDRRASPPANPGTPAGGAH